ncbi:hypothetical protein MKW94_024747 [Papaver nudicaule]|uniref:Nudix hydrolase domain-containing protein n=1 Tax=Papaver nudicaule TaxID=74823 RepID=A0AA41SRL4_PAPNU|nr:hypothetical protein [Papaver nudicaule]
MSRQIPPIKNPSNSKIQHLNFYQKTNSSLPDLLFTAVSLLFLFSSSAASLKPLSLSFNTLNFNFPQNPRRVFLKNSIMSQPKPNPSSFSSPNSLSNWLKSRLPSDSFASWGIKPGTKNVHNLWLEISAGETSLLDSIPPVRTVNVVSVRVMNENGRILLESKQELSDGTHRERNRPLSEKMKPHESVEEAVFRAIKEELGSIIQNDLTGIVKIHTDSYKKKIEERASVSYPGLPACYVLHTVDAFVEGLPSGEFCTEEEEYSECGEPGAVEKAVNVKKHFWKWVEPDSL